ncbi:MAG: hypothetical protein D6731_23185 [Planctomycetota bacterium]|nr:MAG: hypothetical protein D6731_23185 [Planctomycetota bacterium]
MIRNVDHFYVETRHWERSVSFWKGLGFSFADRWGEDGHRAGLLRCGEARLVLAEANGAPEGVTVHFAAEGLEALNARLLADANVDVATPLEDTHWGSRWIRVRDPDGRVYALEARPAQGD